jgi:CheY-like chemotaxis protein
MPGMNGDEVCLQMKKIKSKIKILLASGYVGFYSEDYLISIGFDGFLKKPYDLKQLTEKIEDLLIE